MLFPVRCFHVTKLMVFFNCCTTSRKTSLPQIWFWLRYKHYGGKRTETANNKIFEKYHISKSLGWYFLPWIHAADIFKINGLDFKKYQQSKTTYIPKHRIGLCECSLTLNDLHCEVWDSDYMVTLRRTVDS